MDSVRNPFAPGTGTPPPALVGRKEILDNVDIILGRIKQGRPEKSFLLIGLRGVGKTVLLNKIEEKAQAKGYKTVFIEATEDKKLPLLLFPHLRQLLFSLDRSEQVNETVKRGLKILTSFIKVIKIKYGDMEVGLDYDPEVGTADSGDLEADLPSLFLAIAEAARAKNTPVALIVDEMQYLDNKELSALIISIHKINQKGLPLLLIGAGLPQLVGLTGNSKSYAERLFNFPKIGPLSNSDASRALEEPALSAGISFTPEALKEIIKKTQGYPYFLQEWGYHAWNQASESPISLQVISASHEIVTKKLDESFFRVRFDRLTPREKDYLRAVAELGPGKHRSGDIAEMLNIQVESAAPLRSGLIKKGMIFSPAHGDTEFTVPLFDEFMKRTIPKFESNKKKTV